MVGIPMKATDGEVDAAFAKMPPRPRGGGERSDQDIRPRRGKGVLHHPIDQEQPGTAKDQSHHAAEKSGGETAEADGKEA